MFASFKVEQINDAAGVVSHAIVRMFKSDIYADTLATIRSKNGTKRSKEYCTKFTNYHIWTIFGFIIQV